MNAINAPEIVPNTITATVVVDSPNKTVPINVVPVGSVASGSAISSITPNVENVTLNIKLPVEALEHNADYVEKKVYEEVSTSEYTF